jgi:short-subunit dehydrogenase
MPFPYQTVVITGASSGIGWHLAKELAARGCKVGVTARRRELLEALVEEIRKEGGTAALAPADAADRLETETAIRSLREQLGPIDLLVANAGVGIETLLDPPNLEEIEHTFRVNVLGVVYAFSAVMPEMLQRGSGHLAAVSSLAAYKGLPGESAYCASKAAVNSYLEGLRIQLRGRGVGVTTICPGFVRTPMTDANGFKHMPFLMGPEKAARLIANALRRRKKVFNFPWQTTLMMKLTRWLPDWVIAHFLRDYNKKKQRTAAAVERVQVP